MSGAWYALESAVIALIVWWYLRNDTGPSSPKGQAEKAQRRKAAQQFKPPNG